jgi:hypothetical protein
VPLVLECQREQWRVASEVIIEAGLMAVVLIAMGSFERAERIASTERSQEVGGTGSARERVWGGGE